MIDKYEALKLDNQVCFPLYACSKEIVRAYTPFLKKLDITYTQYITMLVLWEEKQVYVKDLGKKLYLDSGTLTPVLKKLEHKGLVKRDRCKSDERNLCVTLTAEGERLKEESANIQPKMRECLRIDNEEKEVICRILSKVLEGVVPE